MAPPPPPFRRPHKSQCFIRSPSIRFSRNASGADANLERLYQKNLPPRAPIGESWEISDRPGDASVIANGPLAGKNLHWLMENHARELLGDAKPAAGNRFPLLCKILDAREKLSLQVHPPANKAAELGGEPKTEMWFIADAAPDAELFVGLKRGVTRAEFEKKIHDWQRGGLFPSDSRAGGRRDVSAQRPRPRHRRGTGDF